MKKLLIGGLGVLVVVGVVVGIALRHRVRMPGNGAQVAAEPEVTQPTIEVLKPSAYVLAADGTTSRELKTGDTLTPPVDIKVSDGGRAVLNFPDGSMARIAGGTTFTLREGSYDTASGKANTSIFLSIGRIWSKVVELATPDSSWEVETSSAVATVRGTAFDSRADAKQSTFTGSEHTVDVIPVDPKTHARAEEKKVQIKENLVVTLGASDVPNILTGKTKIAAMEEKAAVAAADTWLSENQGEDVKVNQAVQEIKQELKDQLLNGERIPPRLQKQLRERIRERVKEFYLEHPAEFLNLSTSTTPEATTTLDANLPKPTALTIVSVSPSPFPASVNEGDTVTVKAMAKFSDGTVHDLTAKVAWKVLGPIGHMNTPGVFGAQLDPTAAELGEGNGAIVATFTDSATGVSLLGQTPLFKVAALATSTPLNIGGQ